MLVCNNFLVPFTRNYATNEKCGYSTFILLPQQKSQICPKCIVAINRLTLVKTVDMYDCTVRTKGLIVYKAFDIQIPHFIIG